MKPYLLESRTVARHRSRRQIPAPPTIQFAPCRVIPFSIAHTSLVSDALRSGFAVIVTKKRKFNPYDSKALQACLGHLGQISGEFKYGKEIAVLIHKASFPRGHGAKFEMLYPIDSYLSAGHQVTSIVLKHDEGQFLSFTYRVNYLPAAFEQWSLSSVLQGGYPS